MKKTLSVVVALALVLVMSFSCFAALPDEVTAQRPTEKCTEENKDAWTAYYTALLACAPDNTPDVVSAIAGDIQSGDIDAATAFQIIPVAAANAALDSDTVKQVIKGIEEILGVDLPGELPSDFDPSFTLPDFGGSGNGSFLDNIFGILGGLGDILFGGGGDDTEDPTTPDDDDDDDLWGDDTEDPEIPDMGDTSVVAVGAVAAVAVAALVLTRKKNDAE